MPKGGKAGPAPLRPVATYDHLRKKKPLERVVSVPLDGALVEVFQEAQLALGRVELARGDTTEASAAMDAARAAVDATTVTLRFRSIGRPRYDALVRAHPPAPETSGKKSDDPYDIETFPPALIAASCVDPPMTPVQAQALFDLDRLEEDDLRRLAEHYGLDVDAELAARVAEDSGGTVKAVLVDLVRAEAPEWNAAELLPLWMAALEVCTQRKVVELGNSSSGTRG